MPLTHDIIVIHDGGIAEEGRICPRRHEMICLLFKLEITQMSFDIYHASWKKTVQSVHNVAALAVLQVILDPMQKVYV